MSSGFGIPKSKQLAYSLLRKPSNALCEALFLLRGLIPAWTSGPRPLVTVLPRCLSLGLAKCKNAIKLPSTLGLRLCVFLSLAKPTSCCSSLAVGAPSFLIDFGSLGLNLCRRFYHCLRKMVFQIRTGFVTCFFVAC